MKVTGKTNIGYVRRENQDAFVTGQTSSANAFAVVCDGMGGANGGSIASELAVRRISERLAATDLDAVATDSLNYVFESAIAAANIDIFDTAKASPELSGMGTTLVAAVATEQTLLVVHVGDSRAYLLTDEGLRQITKDHSVVQQLVEEGKLTETEAKHHPRKHFITRALGVEETVPHDSAELSWGPGDIVLLCTDGLTNMVEDEEIARLMKENDPAEKLVEAALAAGGTDNITVCIIENEDRRDNNG